MYVHISNVLSITVVKQSIKFNFCVNFIARQDGRMGTTSQSPFFAENDSRNHLFFAFQ